MYELIILSRLVRFPSHGYLIAKIINDIIGPYAKISNGRFYPLLAKLEQEGLIEAQPEPTAEQHGHRQFHRYAITELGRARHHHLMMDTTSNPGEYSKIFLHKIFTFDTLKPEERLYLIDHYINYCQAHILHLRSEEDDIMQSGSSYGLKTFEITSITDAQKHLRQQWELELEWANQLREREHLAAAQAVTVADFSKN